MIQSIQLPKITITSSHARPWIEPKDSHLHLLYPRPLQRLPHRAQALAHGLGVLQLQALVLDAFDLAAVPFRGGTMSCKWIHMRGSRGHFLASATQPPSRSQLTALVQLTALWHIGQKLEKLMASKVTTRRLSSSDTEDQPRPCVPDHGPRKGPWGGGAGLVRSHLWIRSSGLWAFGPGKSEGSFVSGEKNRPTNHASWMHERNASESMGFSARRKFAEERNERAKETSLSYLLQVILTMFSTLQGLAE